MSSFNISDLTCEEHQALAEVRKRKNELLEEIQQIQEEMEQVNSQIDALNLGDDDDTIQQKNLLIGKNKFNADSKKGIKYLMETNCLEESPEAVAKFLYQSEGLKKSSIGDYLGEKSPFNLAVLEHYVKQHDFGGVMLVQALRNFLWNFRLPGEAQKIDRIMEQFAKHFCDLNPNIFDHPDSCYVLCYATIMLNTSLYNPSVKERMNFESFVQLTSTINVSKELVNAIYNSVRHEPFKFSSEDADGEDALTVFFQPDKQGWLTKQGTWTWNRRWFVLSEKCLYYFEFPNDREPRGIITLENVKVRSVEDKTRSNVFEICSKSGDIIKACKADSDGRLVQATHSTYRISAPSREEMNSWISSIQRSINKDDFFDMLYARRKTRNASLQTPPTNSTTTIGMPSRTVEDDPSSTTIIAS